MNKESQRKHITRAIKGMSCSDKVNASIAICDRLMSIASVRFADSIFAYLSLENEVDLTSIMHTWIDESRTIGVPLVSWEDKTMCAGLVTSLEQDSLTKTRYGISEPSRRHPIPADFIDIIIVPGVGFDPHGRRLGRGGGYYDRYLNSARPPIVLGVAFDEQIIEEVCTDPHDQSMTAIVTPTRTLLN